MLAPVVEPCAPDRGPSSLSPPLLSHFFLHFPSHAPTPEASSFDNKKVVPGFWAGSGWAALDRLAELRSVSLASCSWAVLNWLERLEDEATLGEAGRDMGEVDRKKRKEGRRVGGCCRFAGRGWIRWSRSCPKMAQVLRQLLKLESLDEIHLEPPDSQEHASSDQ